MSFVIKNDVLTFYATEEDETEVIIPDGVRVIGKKAFSYCQILEKVHIPESVVLIEEKAFKGCSVLNDILLPAKLENIGRNAFEECTGLKSIVIPNGISVIENWTFQDCTGLVSVVLPDSLKVIKGWAFDGCISLEKINLPDGLEETGGWAFWNCKKLDNLVIPLNLKKAGVSAFGKCAGIILKENNISVKIIMTDEISDTEKNFYEFITEKNICRREELFRTNMPHSLKIPLAVLLAFAYDCNIGENYIKKHSVDTVKYLINADDAGNLAGVLELCEISESNIDELIQYANNSGRYEIQIILSEYRQNNFGSLFDSFDKFFI